MEYTIKKLAEISGTTSRTLRYYDEMDLLKPRRINSSGYRIYGTEEVNLLQQILLFRAMDVSLKDIKQILHNSETDTLTLLKKHQKQLTAKKRDIDSLLRLVTDSIAMEERGEKMSDEAKFTALKKQKAAHNEETYGKEVRKKYGDTAFEETQARILNRNKTDDALVNASESTIKTLLEEKNQWQIPSPEAEKLYHAHKEWLMHFWNPPYNGAAHKELAQMYTADQRFTDYYEKLAGKGAADTLCQVIQYYA